MTKSLSRTTRSHKTSKTPALWRCSVRRDPIEKRPRSGLQTVPRTRWLRLQALLGSPAPQPFRERSSPSPPLPTPLPPSPGPPISCVFPFGNANKKRAIKCVRAFVFPAACGCEGLGILRPVAYTSVALVPIEVERLRLYFHTNL